MDGENNTTVNKFLLLGLTRSAALQSFHFITFIAIYGATLVGNLLIIVLLICEPRIQPMYILLQNLSFLDCCYSSITAPKVLTGFLLPPPQAISFVGCIVQIFFFHFTGGIKIFFLTVIAYDHYVAIFHTFCYMILRNQMVCVGLLVICCVGGFLHSIVQVAVIVQLPFCGPKELDNFYCGQVVRLASRDTITMELLMVSNNGLVTCFIVLIISYSILLAKLTSHSSQERCKGFSTCVSHVTVITFIFGPCIYIYTRPFFSYPVDKAISLLYTVITPVLNPIIYMLMNKDLKVFLRKLW
ncbi:LOW QUALITY PROTEIN: olfactory receptor 4D5-like [Ciconia maguari]